MNGNTHSSPRPGPATAKQPPDGYSSFFVVLVVVAGTFPFKGFDQTAACSDNDSRRSSDGPPLDTNMMAFDV